MPRTMTVTECVDIAVDPLEGTTLCAKDMPGAIAVTALAEAGSLLAAGLQNVRADRTGAPAFAFLFWNLFLAWMPYLLALTFVGLWMYNNAKGDVARRENKRRGVEARREGMLPTTREE